MEGSGKRRLGIFGGSFNPVHFGHVQAAVAFAITLALDEVIVLPAAAPFYKRTNNIGFEHRYAMCKLAFADMKNVTVSDLEKAYPEGMYTCDVLGIMRQKNVGAKLFLLMGSDVFGTLPQWEGVREIVATAQVAVMQRNLVGACPRQPIITGAEFTFIDAEIPSFSSSRVRESIRRGEPVDAMVPAAVAEYIRNHRLYVKEGSTVCCPAKSRDD